MNKITIIWHIGWHKTGTTTIQQFLHQNRRALMERHGLLYPEAGLINAGHHLLADAVSKRDLYGPRDRRSDLDYLEREWGRLADEIGRTPRPALVLLSSEGFRYAEPGRVAQLLRRYGVDAIHQVILYVRLPDLMLESLFAQEIKAGSWNGSFADFAESRMTRGEVGYQQVVECWQHFGDTPVERIVVRPFERGQWKDQDLVADFLHAIGLEDTAELARHRQADEANRRPDVAMLSLVAALNRAIGGKRPLRGQGAVESLLEVAADRRARCPVAAEPARFLARADREHLRSCFDPVFEPLGLHFVGRHHYPDGGGGELLDIGALPSESRLDLLIFGMECGLLSLDRLCAELEDTRAELDQLSARARAEKARLAEKKQQIKHLKREVAKPKRARFWRRVAQWWTGAGAR